MAQREPEPGGLGAPTVPNEFACGVVDHRDVIGVEGMSNAEQVGGESHPDIEHSLRSEAEVLRNHRDDQHPPPHQVETSHHVDGTEK